MYFMLVDRIILLISWLASLPLLILDYSLVSRFMPLLYKGCNYVAVVRNDVSMVVSLNTASD
jgi:hypothetical protein